MNEFFSSCTVAGDRFNDEGCVEMAMKNAGTLLVWKPVLFPLLSVMLAASLLLLFNVITCCCCYFLAKRLLRSLLSMIDKITG